MKNIYLALSKAQGEFQNIDLNATVKVNTKDGRSYTFDYATLGQIMNFIRPILAKNELATYQTIEENCMQTTIIHSSGESLLSKLPLPSLTEKAQERGSVISYFRRYGLVTALGLIAEDDEDGNIADGNDYKKGIEKNQDIPNLFFNTGEKKSGDGNYYNIKCPDKRTIAWVDGNTWGILKAKYEKAIITSDELNLLEWVADIKK